MDPTELDAGLEGVEQRLGYRFTDRTLLETALTHRSHAHEQGTTPGRHYERQEFLGDSLLGFLVSDWLYRADPQADEGLLSRRRQSVVRTSTLATVARELGLGQAILLGRGEFRTGGREKPSLLADTFEAVLGAVFLDGGIRPSRAFVRRHLGRQLKRAAAAVSIDDYKTRLQESVQARLQRTPRYRIVKTRGPDHALEFEVEVCVDGEVLGQGVGGNRKKAEQQAAREALDRLDETPGVEP